MLVNLERLRKLFAKRKQRMGWQDGDACWLWPANARDKVGYGVLTYRVGKVLQKVLVHRLSYALHKEPIPGGLQVRHDCDTPACCNPRHLRVGTQQDNEDDKRARNRLPRGEAKGNAKLTAETVRAVRAGKQAGLSNRELALTHGVSVTLVREVVSGRLWGHVDEEE